MRPPSNELHAGIRAGAVLTPAVVVFAASFGVLAVQAGLPAAGSLLLSATAFAGSAQLAATSVLAQHGGVVAAVLAAALLNARYIAIGSTLAPALAGPVWRRALDSLLITDESWAIAADPDGRYSRLRMLGAGGVLWVAWMLGTALGVFAADYIPDPVSLGLDMAFTALFIGLLPGQLRSGRAVLAAVIGGAVALLFLTFSSAAVAVIAGSVGCLVGPVAEYRRKKDRVPGYDDE
jgi:predicted branched-subunit amino acid permease